MILVLLYHAQVLIQGGYVGVDVFFVISGFVIAAGIFRELDRREGQFSFRSFYERRMRRLLPSLAVTVSLTLCVGLFLAPYSSLKFMRRTGLAATFFNANHYLMRGVDYFAPAAERNALLHTWSLSVEEQFYFVFPLLFVLVATYVRRRHKLFYRGVGLIMGGLFALSLGAELYVSYGGSKIWGIDGSKLAFFGAPLRAWEFGVGVLLATALPSLQYVDRPVMRKVLALGGLLLIMVSALCYTGATLFPGSAALVPVLGAAMILMAGSFAASSPLPVVSNRALTRAGDLSYGWYLWHWPPLVFIHATWPGDLALPVMGTLVLSLGLAWLNERLVERPLRHASWVKKKYANLAILIVCFGLPVLAFFFQRAALVQLRAHPSIAALNAIEKEYDAIGCNYNAYDASQKTCRWGDVQAPWRVVLVGDSNARQFIPALRELVPSLGGEFHTATFNQCLFADLHVRRHDSTYEACTTWVNETMAELEAHPPDVVMISSAYDAYLAEDAWSFESQEESGVVYRSRSERIQALQESTRRLSARLTAMGSRVVFIKPIPKYKSYESFIKGEVDLGISFGADCSLFKLVYLPESCNATRPLKESKDREWGDVAYGREAYRTALGDEVHELIVDGALCPEGECRAKQKDTWIYRDTAHVTPDGARLTTPLFSEFLTTHRP